MPKGGAEENDLDLDLPEETEKRNDKCSGENVMVTLTIFQLGDQSKSNSFKIIFRFLEPV